MKRRGWLYVPGLISLLGLPVVLLVWGPRDPVWETVMKVKLPSEAKDPGLLMFSRETVLRHLKGKKVVSFWFDDRPSHLYPETNPYRRSVFLLNEMARQQFTRDTGVVLRVSFDARNDYGDVVWMLNNARLFDYRIYAYLDDDLYLFANPPPPPPDTTSLRVDMFGDDVVVAELRPPPAKWDIFWERMKGKWQEFAYAVKRSYLLCIGFMLLIVLPALLYKRKPA